MASKTVSTNVRGISWLGGASVANHERGAMADKLSAIEDAWGREVAALKTTLPAITAAAAPTLAPLFKVRLDAALVAIITAETHHLARHLEAGDSLTAMVAATPHIDAALAMINGGFKPLIELARTLATTFARLAPPHSVTTPAPSAPVVPLIDLARDGKAALTHIARAIMRGQGCAARLADTVARNLANATGHDPDDTSRALPAPHTLDGDAADAAILTFADTPILDLLLTPVPIVTPLETRFRHTHIVAGTGWGKTQLLQHQIAAFLAEPNPPSLLIIDSQSDMLNLISRLAIFEPGKGRLADKLVIIDPRDGDAPPALNLFAVNSRRHAAMTAMQREQMTNSLIWIYEIIFRAMLNAELTQKQQLLFRFLTRLMLTVPGATIVTLREALEDLTPFQSYIDQLDGEARNFLTSPIVAKDFKETSEQVWRRLYGILEQPAFARMFSTPTRKLDLYDCMQSGKIILVNTAKDHLSPENSMILGRTFVAFALQAALERAAIDRSQRHPAFIFLDEASETLDSSAERILDTARKYNIGLIAAHQRLEQLSTSVRAALATTAIKMAGGVSDPDAHAMAREMHTDQSAIRNLERGDRSTQFLTYIQGTTPQAVPITTPFFTLENMPRMNEVAYQRLLADNRRRYCEAAATTLPRGLNPTRPGANPIPPAPQPAPRQKGRGVLPTIPKADDDWRS